MRLFSHRRRWLFCDKMNTCAQKQTHVRAKEKGLRIPSVSLVNHTQTKQICGCGYTHAHTHHPHHCHTPWLQQLVFSEELHREAKRPIGCMWMKKKIQRNQDLTEIWIIQGWIVEARTNQTDAFSSVFHWHTWNRGMVGKQTQEKKLVMRKYCGFICWLRGHKVEY